MKRVGYLVILTAAILCLPTCRSSRTISIQVPHGFHGRVEVGCEMRDGFPSGTVNVNAFGNGVADACPSQGGYVTVFCDGGPVEHTSVTWERTGDQLLVGFAFTVK